jgi:ArsR family transcriptional regulator
VDRGEAERIARNLRAMADPTRVQILALIVESADGKSLVGELAATLGLQQPTVSHHVRIMAEEGLLLREQVGRQVWYSIAPERVADVVESTQADPIVSVVAPSVLARIASDLDSRFRGTFSPETIDRYVRESYDLLAERAQITRYLPSLTARFAADRLRGLAKVQSAARADVPEVLFVCVHNAGRSQLASAIARAIAGDRVRVRTAGSEPSAAVNPVVAAALDEIGVSLGSEFPKPLTDEAVRAADFVITMGCGDVCPIYPGPTYLDWEIADPMGLPLNRVREIRDEVEHQVRSFLAQVLPNP